MKGESTYKNLTPTFLCYGSYQFQKIACAVEKYYEQALKITSHIHASYVFMFQF